MLAESIRTALFALVCFPASVLAHPGHGVDDGGYSVWHYLLDPLHAGGAIAALAGIAIFTRIARARSRRRLPV